MGAVDEILISEAGRRLTLRDLRLPADVIVVSRDYAKRWRDVRGGLVHAAFSQGRVLARGGL